MFNTYLGVFLSCAFDLVSLFSGALELIDAFTTVNLACLLLVTFDGAVDSTSTLYLFY